MEGQITGCKKKMKGQVKMMGCSLTSSEKEIGGITQKSSDGKKSKRKNKK